MVDCRATDLEWVERAIPPFSEGTDTAQVRLLNYRSASTNWVGDRPWWALLALSIGMVVVRRWRGRTDSVSIRQ